jgi:peptidoglycan-associated lipoprotein
MKRLIPMLALTGLFLSLGPGLTGCASNQRLEPPAPVEDRMASSRKGGATGSGTLPDTPMVGVQTSGIDDPTRLTQIGGTGVGQSGTTTAGNVIYFAVDSFNVTEEFRGVVERYATQLKSDRHRRLMVEGHTDEQGGREYNVALGDKRAQAVIRELKLLGAQASQLEAVSYGEERPAVAGHNESVWARNRRVELKEQ